MFATADRRQFVDRAGSVGIRALRFLSVSALGLAFMLPAPALHNHMLDERPRLFFMHFWANGELGKLLKGLHAALANVAVAKG